MVWLAGHTPEEVGQAISELSRALSTNEIALFSHRVSEKFWLKFLHSSRNKSRKNIHTQIFSKLSSIVIIEEKIWSFLQKSLR